MQTENIYELVGYIASLLVVISLMMSALVRLRIVNMVGAFLFSLYGLLIGSIPVAAMNGIIVLVNIYYLARIYRDQEYFSLLEVDEGSSYTRAFLRFYEKHIKADQPSFAFEEKRNFSLFVLRDMVPAGLIQGTICEDGILRINLDFVIPHYRDFKVGRFLFRDNPDFFRSRDIKAIRASAGSEAHNRYLEKTGFQRTSDDEAYAYFLPLSDKMHK